MNTAHVFKQSFYPAKLSQKSQNRTVIKLFADIFKCIQVTKNKCLKIVCCFIFKAAKAVNYILSFSIHKQTVKSEW